MLPKSEDGASQYSPLGLNYDFFDIVDYGETTTYLLRTKHGEDITL